MGSQSQINLVFLSTALSITTRCGEQAELRERRGLGQVTLKLEEQSWDHQERARMHSHALESLNKQLRHEA